jgi:hypothetical protein
MRMSKPDSAKRIDAITINNDPIVLRQFKSEVQQVLMAENKVLRKVFDSQEIFMVCD